MKKLFLIAFSAILTLTSTMAMAQPPQGGGERQQPSAEERMEQLKEKLDLTDEQCEQIAELEANRTMPERGDREAMKAMMEEEKAAMKEILTDKQYKKWEKMQSQRGPQGGGGQGQRPSAQ